MNLKISKVFKSNGGLTAVSIDNESFKSIVGRTPTMPEIKDSYHKVGELGVRAFQFDNARLITSFDKNTNKTRCYVANEAISQLPKVSERVGEFSNINFSAFDSE